MAELCAARKAGGVRMPNMWSGLRGLWLCAEADDEGHWLAPCGGDVEESETEVSLSGDCAAVALCEAAMANIGRGPGISSIRRDACIRSS